MNKSIQKFLSFLLLFSLLITGCSTTNTNPPKGEHSFTSSIPNVSSTPSKTSSELKVHFIDVGQADCILIQNKEENVLIDSGNRADFDTIKNYLEQLGVTTIQHFILTHPHEDHIGSAAKIVEHFNIERAYMTDASADSNVYKSLMEQLKNKAITPIYPSIGDNFSIGETIFTFLGPASAYEDVNSMSLVVRADFGSNSFLFTGDTTDEAERDLLNEGVNLEADVLKVAHHGSRDSNTYVFLKAVNPTYSVISVGIDNDYGHPTEDVLSRLNDVGSTLFRTDVSGTIVATSDGTNITWNTTGQESTREHISDGNGLVEDEDEVEYSTSYIGNKNSKVLHLPSCGALPKEENQVRFSSKQEALDKGYHACQRCNP